MNSEKLRTLEIGKSPDLIGDKNQESDALVKNSAAV